MEMDGSGALVAGLPCELIPLCPLPLVVLRRGHHHHGARGRIKKCVVPQADLAGSVHILKHDHVSREFQTVLDTEGEEAGEQRSGGKSTQTRARSPGSNPCSSPV